jgi:hypothetical protein
MINVGKAAKGEDVESVDEAVTYFDDESNGRLIHHYRLREDFEVKVELPKNFNPSEAERFANFVKTLPFGA